MVDLVNIKRNNSHLILITSTRRQYFYPSGEEINSIRGVELFTKSKKRRERKND